MSEPSMDQVQQALKGLPRLPQVRSILSASMDPLEMISTARESEKYQMDSDFHILIDIVANLLTTISVLEQDMLAMTDDAMKDSG